MKHDYYHVGEWDPKVKQKAEEIILNIHALAPELECLFMGAAALGLPGKNDIDLDILCDQNDISKFARMLEKVLGVSTELKDAMVIWSYMDDGIEIDCILSDPKRPESHVPIQKRRFEKFKSDPVMREQYRQLKYDWDGLPYKEYEDKKKAFLETI